MATEYRVIYKDGTITPGYSTKTLAEFVLGSWDNEGKIIKRYVTEWEDA